MSLCYHPHQNCESLLQHMQDTVTLFLTNKKPLFYFLSGKQNRCFIHYDPDYAQSSILSAQFKSKVIEIRI